MNVFAGRLNAAAEPTASLRGLIGRTIRRAGERVAALNARIDQGRALRDRANEANRAVDRAFWIYLR